MMAPHSPFGFRTNRTKPTVSMTTTGSDSGTTFVLLAGCSLIFREPARTRLSDRLIDERVQLVLGNAALRYLSPHL